MFKYITHLLLLLLAVTSCRNQDYILEHYSNDDDPYDESQVDLVNYPDWTEATHSNAVDPNFSVVFTDNTVQRIDITITDHEWSVMWDDLEDNLTSGGGPGMGMGVGGGEDTSVDFTPIWVPCMITHDDTDWYKVGIRFKGNSSLRASTMSDNEKLSFKLDFDQYEEDYPALTNQRFYGFKQLNLNCNYNDLSLVREKVAYDLFRESGMVAANASFYELYINDQYYGLYTLVEEVDDTVIKTQFSSATGNLYKPEEQAGSFASGTYDIDEFYLKTNIYVCDFSDVRSLYTTLKSSSRTSDEEAWKTKLESIFDVDTFLKWLAINTTIQNWDAYGNMAHNYFLYNNPSNSKLTWIPWDYNEAFQDATKGNYKDYTPESLGNVTPAWPLIKYLYAVDEYKAKFDAYLKEFINGPFEPTKMAATYESYYNLLKESAYKEERDYSYIYSSIQFDGAISTLKTQVQERYDLINTYLESLED